MTHFMGFRDCCRQCVSFTSKEERDLWEHAKHTCVDGEEDGQDDDFEVGAW